MADASESEAYSDGESSTSVKSTEVSCKSEDGLMAPVRKRRLKDEKICRVCGDKALGYNFNAITCESCKAFFRRNALKEKMMKCLFHDNCQIDVRTRRFCPACRLAKCLHIGMKKEMILDENERRARMAKVMENRVKRECSGPSPPTRPTIKEEPLDFDLDVPKVESSGMFMPSMASCSMPSHDDDDNLFKQAPQEEMPTEPEMYRQLTHAENSLVAEITASYQSTVVVRPDFNATENHYKDVNDLINQSEAIVRRLIKFVKHLDDFRSLSQEDQIASLKAAVMKSLLIRSAAFYDVAKDAWLTPKGEISTNILKKATGYVDLHESHVRYCRSLKSITGENKALFALIQIIVIFNPCSGNIKDRMQVSALQDKYMLLLKHYLESEVSFVHAQRYYSALMDRVTDLKTLSDGHAKVLMRVNPMEIEPLMLEVLDLK